MVLAMEQVQVINNVRHALKIHIKVIRVAEDAPHIPDTVTPAMGYTELILVQVLKLVTLARVLHLKAVLMITDVIIVQYVVQHNILLEVVEIVAILNHVIIVQYVIQQHNILLEVVEVVVILKHVIIVHGVIQEHNILLEVVEVVAILNHVILQPSHGGRDGEGVYKE